MKPQMFESDLDSPAALRMMPVKRYSAPGYPTYSDARRNPALLKKLPSRWQSNAKVVACVGMLGTVAMAGCDVKPRDSSTQTNIVASVRGDNHAKVRVHGGGCGGSAYVVYLTEMEALSIIKAEAKAEGLQINENNFVEYKRYRSFVGDIDIKKRHRKAFAISVDDDRPALQSYYFSSFRRSEPVREAFRDTTRTDGVQWKESITWKEFIQLWKEQADCINDAKVKIHHGDKGDSFYVVHFAENLKKEALEVIQTDAFFIGLGLRPYGKDFENAMKIEGGNFLMGFDPAKKAFEESGTNGVRWVEFLKLLKEKKEER